VAALLLLIGILQPLVGSPAAAQDAPTSGLPENVLQASVRITEVIEVTPDDEDEDPFICELNGSEYLENSIGSGTIITDDGYILTNHHVIASDSMPRDYRDYCEDQAPRGGGDAEWMHLAWLPDEKGTPSEAYRVDLVEDTNMREDMAILKMTEHVDGSEIEDPFPFVQFGDSDDLHEPETIFLVGYPLNAGSSRRVSEGIFSGWGDNGYGVPWIYTDATISGGNSGGTAVDANGLLIGIPTEGTFSDCRPGDTNNDGQTNEDDQGCVGLGGNYGILIPSNIAHEFVSEATGEELPVISSERPEEPATDPATEEPTEEPNQDGPAIGDVTFYAYGVDGEELDTFQGVNQIDGCFENFTIEEGQELTITWYLDGEVVLTTDYEWDDSWNPEACASVFIEPTEADPYLAPGTYQMDVIVGGETYTSDEVEVTNSSNVESVSFRGRDSDRNEIEADADNVLSGEVVSLYADIEFTNMSEGSIWQASLYLDDELVFSSDAEAWEGAATGSESVRMRNEDRTALDPGDYEVVITVDNVESARVTVTIED
jgi:S1-C subfamily serine protease